MRDIFEEDVAVECVSPLVQKMLLDMAESYGFEVDRTDLRGPNINWNSTDRKIFPGFAKNISTYSKWVTVDEFIGALVMDREPIPITLEIEAIGQYAPTDIKIYENRIAIGLLEFKAEDVDYIIEMWRNRHD